MDSEYQYQVDAACPVSNAIANPKCLKANYFAGGNSQHIKILFTNSQKVNWILKQVL
jgi:hypothetical protein